LLREVVDVGDGDDGMQQNALLVPQLKSGHAGWNGNERQGMAHKPLVAIEQDLGFLDGDTYGSNILLIGGGHHGCYVRAVESAGTIGRRILVGGLAVVGTVFAHLGTEGLEDLISPVGVGQTSIATSTL
jgi:hypothetical protein